MKCGEIVAVVDLYVDYVCVWVVLVIACVCFCAVIFFFFKQKTAYEIRLSLVGSEMCIRDSSCTLSTEAGPFLRMGMCWNVFDINSG